MILTPSLIDELVMGGKVAANSRTDFARTGIGICVRRERPKPDVSSTAALRRSLLAAASITYNPEVFSGRYAQELLQRLGIADQVRSKVVSAAAAQGPNKVTGVVARGEAELGIVITTDILADDGVELVGPLPSEVQSYTTFAAATGATATESAGGRALLEFLRSTTSIRALLDAGMERPQP